MGDIEKVLIVGGGVGGLSTGIALRKVGVEVDLVEKNPKWDVYGVGIIQPPNALRALHFIGVAEQCLAQGHPIVGGRTHLADGTLVQDDTYPPVVPGWPPMNGLTRPALHEILKGAVRDAGVNVRVGETITAIVQREDGVDVTFTDGTSGSYDLLVGRGRPVLRDAADAVRRCVQAALYRRGLLPLQPAADRRARPDRHVHRRRARDGWVRSSVGHGHVHALHPQPGPRTSFGRTRAGSMRSCARSSSRSAQPIAEHRSLINDPTKVVYRPVDNIILPSPWYRGRALLIGDAAHGTSPHAGQGAAQAIEDGVVLAEEIASGKSAQEVLDAFMERRYERCKAVVEMSAAIGEWEQHPDPNVDVTALRNQIIEVCSQPV